MKTKSLNGSRNNNKRKENYYKMDERVENDMNALYWNPYDDNTYSVMKQKENNIRGVTL